MPEKTKQQVNEAIGIRLTKARNAKKLSAHRLGIYVGASGSQVKTWEMGASPNLYYVQRLCEVLDVTPTYLIMGKKTAQKDVALPGPSVR